MMNILKINLKDLSGISAHRIILNFLKIITRLSRSRKKIKIYMKILSIVVVVLSSKINIKMTKIIVVKRKLTIGIKLPI
jgi:hypothetical protein